MMLTIEITYVQVPYCCAKTFKEHKIAIDAKFLRKQHKKREFMNARMSAAALAALCKPHHMCEMQAKNQ